MPVVYLGVGSNIQRKKNIALSLSSLKTRYPDLECSSVYETESYGFEGDHFYNLIARFFTTETPQQVKSFLREIELQQGRPTNAEKFKPRTIDLDFLMYGDLISDEPGMQIPRDDVLQYSFVLEPFAELAPDERYPGSNKTYRELWDDYLQNQTPVASNKIIWSPFVKNTG